MRTAVPSHRAPDRPARRASPLSRAVGAALLASALAPTAGVGAHATLRAQPQAVPSAATPAHVAAPPGRTPRIVCVTPGPFPAALGAGDATVRPATEQAGAAVPAAVPAVVGEPAEVPCGGAVAREDHPQRALLRVRIEGIDPAAPRPMVHFRASAGALTADSVRVGPDDAASVVWHRAEGGKRVVVGMTVTTDAGSASRDLWLVPARAPAKASYAVVVADGSSYDHPRVGFEKTRLHSELIVEVRRLPGSPDAPAGTRDSSALSPVRTVAAQVTREDSLRGDVADVVLGSAVDDRATCEAQRVVFRRIGPTGFVTPDTATPALIPDYQPPRRRQRLWARLSAPAPRPDRRPACLAYANWTLADAVGLYDARATVAAGETSLPGGNAAEFRAYARPLPKLVAGFAITHERRFLARQAAGFAVRQLQRPLAGGGIELVTDTVRTGRDTLEARGGAANGAAVLGLAAAPVARLRWLTLVGGLDAGKPDENWYAGLSVLRLANLVPALRRFDTEGLFVDVHTVAHVGSVPVLDDATACASTGQCRTRDRVRFRGVALMLSIDASSLLTDVFKRLAGL